MLTLVCSACQKKLAVKEGLAGKKVKCPGCGQVTAVPAQAAPVGNEDLRMVPPAPIPDGPTVPPRPAEPSDTPTNPSLSKPDATQGFKNESSHDSRLTDFLAPPQADDELGRLGDFRILKILGHGGMGVVFLGEDAKLRRKVAIKAMLPHLAESETSQQRFLREARSAATLEHDHIVAIHHVGEDRGAPYIVMPFLKGEPLDERLKRDEPMSVSEIVRIGREVAEGLNAAHALGLVHRDIKPANIWLEAPKNRVKILDFGLARPVAEDAGLTQQGSIMGTPAYMAPEQGRGERVDARCDLWSLGVVLYRMCTGQMPFQGKDTVSTLMAVAMNEPAAPNTINSAVPEELSDLVMKLLEKDPDRRNASAAEVVQVIQGMEKQLARQRMDEDETEGLNVGDPKHGITTQRRAGAATASPRPGQATTTIPAPPRRRFTAFIAAALLAVVVILALGGVYCWQTNNGTVRIEINDPGIKVAFDNKGPTITGVDKQDIKLTPGEFGLSVERGDLKFDTDKFILKKGDTITLKIEWFKEGKLQVVQGDKVIGEKDMPKVGVAVGPPPYVPLTLAEKEAKQLQQDWAAKLKVPVEEKSKLGIVMVVIPPGGEAVPQPYRLGKYEVTQGEWDQVMGYNPSVFGPSNAKMKGMDTSKFPVEQVSWFDSVEFCNKLSEKEGLKPYYELVVTKRTGMQIQEAEAKILGGSGYHIPTDAEWEHGCRAGTKTRYHCGDKDEDLLDYAWFDRNSDGRPHAVGEKKPNAFGLYDMHGNVREWNEEMLTNAKGAPERVLRDSSWYNPAVLCAVSHRPRLGPAARNNILGLRLARVP